MGAAPCGLLIISVKLYREHAARIQETRLVNYSYRLTTTPSFAAPAQPLPTQAGWVISYEVFVHGLHGKSG